MAKDKHSGPRTKDRASPLALTEAHERAVEQLQAGAHDEAERTCAEILAQAPGRAPTQRLLGVVPRNQTRPSSHTR